MDDLPLSLGEQLAQLEVLQEQLRIALDAIHLKQPPVVVHRPAATCDRLVVLTHECLGLAKEMSEIADSILRHSGIDTSGKP
jgi:hypothetical protein